MPTGDICVANIGTPVPLSYGFFRATGMRLIDFTVPATSSDMPNMQIGFWALGEGELDGCDALWIDNVLQFALDPSGVLMGTSTVGVTPSDPATSPTLTEFSFHRGPDSPVGASPGYSGSSQWIDPLWPYLGSLVTPLCYSRISYYAIGWTPPTDGSASLAPVADFRGMRCRTFDSYGNQTGYGFTTNPIWHAVDLWLRRCIKPEYAIDALTGPDPLTSDESSRFNWASIYESAQYCDELLANGRPRFEGSYVFASGSTLASMLEQVLLCCRGYQYEYAGQIFIKIDKPRSSTFVISARHLVPGSIQRDDVQVSQNANRYVASFLELGLPAVSAIASITRSSSSVGITTVHPNPCAAGDLISVGGVLDSSFDASYSVSSTPSDIVIDATVSGGVSASSTGGYIGYIQSRFSQRTPEISHLQHQIASGQILPVSVTGTRLKRIKVTYDFASMTYDQANRLLKYEVYRDLGLDQSPYLPPFGITLSLYSESTDSGGEGGALRALKAQLQGDVVTLDQTAFYELAGDYEIMERYFNFAQQEVEDFTDGNFLQPPARSASFAGSTDSDSGILKLVLRSYQPACFIDVSDEPNSSFQTVPGQLPYSGSGDSESSAGFTVVSGSFTVTTTYLHGSFGPGSPGSASASWTAISIRLGSGAVLFYYADSSGTLAAPGTYKLYINDPGLSGGASKVFVGTPPSPGTGVFVLDNVVVPTTSSTYTNPV